MARKAGPTAAKRPDITEWVGALIRDVARRVPEFSHIKASRVLVVAGEARRASRATVRPMCFDNARRTSPSGQQRKPLVRVGGRRVLYVVTLRPLFFRDATPEMRVATVLHELFHISRQFDGTLDRGRRHSALPGAEFARRFRPLVDRYLELCPAPLLDAFAYDGPAIARQWLEKPGPSYPLGLRSGRRRYNGRRVYTERQLFAGPVRMITRARLN
jgi:hypothetical protein